MPRKKKKEQLTIKSSESKILFGTILFVTGLIVVVSPFLILQSNLFSKISVFLGYSAISWGIFLVYVSMFLLLKSRKFISVRQAIGIFLFSACVSILLSFWQQPEQLANKEALQGTGGELGKILHTSLNGVFGGAIEIIIVITALIVAFSLIT